MGHTNSTVNYNLPQFVGTDKPSWLGDVNGAFLAIDAAIAAAKAQADSAAGGVSSLQNTVGSHTTQIGTLTDTVTAQGGTLNSVTALIGNGAPTTTDQTIIGAINELNAEINKGSVSVTADGVKTRKQLLEDLFAVIDFSKVTGESHLERYSPGVNIKQIFNCSYHQTGTKILKFIGDEIEPVTAHIYKTQWELASTSSCWNCDISTTPAVQFSDTSSFVETAGITLTVTY